LSYEAPNFEDWYEEDESLLPAENPTIDYEDEEDCFTLRWDNTVIREFLVGDGAFDYFVLTLSEGYYFSGFFSEIDSGEELREKLQDYDFPVQIYPTLDETTIALYARVKAEQLP
jgi:hypothetical protein